MGREVILDTNVFIAASFNPKSSSRRIIDAVRHGSLNLIWDEATRRETKKLLSQIPVTSWQKYAELFSEDACHDTKVNKQEFRSSIDDPDDRKFAALAKSSGAPIVSSDDDLLKTQQATGLKVYTPREFVGTFSGRQDIS